MKEGRASILPVPRGTTTQILLQRVVSQGTVQPRGPLKGNVSQEFGIKIKECKGDVLSFMFRNVSGQFCAAPCAGTVALPPETYSLEWEMAL